MERRLKTMIWGLLMERISILNDTMDSISDWEREAIADIKALTSVLNADTDAYVYTLTLITHEQSKTNEFVISRYGIGSKTVEYNFL